MKNYHLDLVRVTEAGAISAAEWVGRGNKEAADKAATDSMRDRLNMIDFLAEIAIGEGKKDESYGLYKGEVVGGSNPYAPDRQNGVEYSIAVDPIEGTTPTAKGGYEAMTVIALGAQGAFFETESFYMKKLAVGPRVSKKFKLDLRQSVEHNIACVAAALDKQIRHVTVCVLDRPRHEILVGKLRDLGCRIKFISDCDVTACIATCVPDSGIDIYLSVGGAPEAVLAAAAMKCMGGHFQAMLTDNKGDTVDDVVYGTDDLARGDVMFCATGITNGQLLKGVQFTSRGPVTHSVTMRSESKTIRWMTTEHGN
jgi:fructose-1,6-bisphosphatase class II